VFRTKKLVVFAVVFLLAIASSAFALDVAELRQQMWTWSSLEAVLQESNHMGGSVISPVEAENCIIEAVNKITKMVSEIKTADEMAKARATANEFINMDGHEEEVGLSLSKMLDKQEKFLKAHQEL